MYEHHYLMYEHHSFILRIMSQYDLKINVGHYDLYFMVQ